MTRELRVGLVGCGRIAERGYVPALVAGAGPEALVVATPPWTRATAV